MLNGVERYTSHFERGTALGASTDFFEALGPHEESIDFQVRLEAEHTAGDGDFTFALGVQLWLDSPDWPYQLNHEKGLVVLTELVTTMV